MNADLFQAPENVMCRAREALMERFYNDPYFRAIVLALTDVTFQRCWKREDLMELAMCTADRVERLRTDVLGSPLSRPEDFAKVGLESPTGARID